MNVIYRHMTEAQLQEQVIAMAHLFGWKVMHSRPARRGDGSWSTPIQGDKGFPDLVLARDGYVMFVELKTETGRVGSSQKDWLHELDSERVDPGAPCTHRAFIWRPSILPELEAILR